MRWIEYTARLIGTGIAFASVFFGGGVLAVTLLPILALLPGHKQQRARRTIHRAFLVYVTLLQRLHLISLQTSGAEKLRQAGGRMVVANHPSLLDVVLLMAIIPNAQCIIKHELWDHRFLGALMRAAGYIRNDLAPEAMIEACRDSLDRGDCLIVFPEGTRTVPREKPRLRRGFANLATLTGTQVQPVRITCDPPTLIKGERWWVLPPRTPLFTVAISDCIDPQLYANERHRSLAARKLVRALEAHYAEHL